MKYTKDVKEYCKLLLEGPKRNVDIAKELIKEFSIEKPLNSVASWVRSQRQSSEVDLDKKPIKRLFFDLETSRVKGWFWRTGKQYIGPQQIMEESKIICASYKWSNEEEVKHLVWDKNQDDKKLVEEMIDILGDASEIVAHNGDRFDIKRLRTRAIKNRLLMYPTYRTLDTLKKARAYFDFSSNKLDYLGNFLDVGRKLDHEGWQLWAKVEEGDKQALKKMIEYCDQDVILLEDVHTVLSPYIWHNNNMAVLSGKPKWACPECASKDVEMYRVYATPSGIIKRNMRCGDCNKQYRINNNVFKQYLTRGV
jgi:DNA polymerase elongation subunit (family B)